VDTVPNHILLWMSVMLPEPSFKMVATFGPNN
jgi:hypothetical protein